tara:strand:+ start:175 stop:1332 length:1158 start_codon:yes stop_codon:yes gene_type:complete
MKLFSTKLNVMTQPLFLFPFAAAINFFSITALIIIASFVKKEGLAADIAIIQGAILAIFLSLSGNARNLILASKNDTDERDLLYFRLLILLPAIIAVIFLIKISINVSISLVFALVLRRCSEWFAELQLANREKCGDFIFAMRYIKVNTLGFLAIVSTLIFSGLEMFYLSLYIWGILPLVFLWSYIRFIAGVKLLKVSFKQLVPHIGSTAVIGVSTFIFRLLIIILAGKVLAGQMFSAYALGGVMSALYTYAVGPSLMLENRPRSLKPLIFIVSFCVVSGMLIILTKEFWSEMVYSPIFLSGLGYSIIGGGLMILAQRRRLYLLQVCKCDVFVPDTLVNILLTISVPYIYYLTGDTSFTFFFLWSAVLNCLFYLPINKRIVGMTL